MQFFSQIILSTLLVSLTACDQAKMEGVSKKTSAGTQEPRHQTDQRPEAEVTTDTEVTTETELTTEAEAALASPPVPIAGAYLVCSLLSPLEAECLAFDNDAKASDFVAENAYILNEGSLAWVDVTFAPAGYGRWLISLPKIQLESFAIVLGDRDNKILGDWIVNPDALVGSVAADGGFESMTDGAVAKPGSNSSYFFGDQQSPWKSKLPENGAICSKPVIEIQKKNELISSFEGELVAELNSTCFDTDPAGPNNSILYQDLVLKAGHFYELRFMYRHRPDSTRPSQIRVRFGGEEVFNKSGLFTEWTEMRQIVVAKQAAATIEFEELNLSRSGRGIAIDDVRVYDLGSGI